MAIQKPLVFLALNEINFDIASRYTKRLTLPNIKRILDGDLRRTSSECNYEQLEPWIQWVSIHTGRTAAEHGIFRLGDIVNKGISQFFEVLEARGKRVGAVSPMNTENKLSNPAYFIPDPWTATPPDNTFWSRRLAKSISQAVNDNSEGRITVGNLAILALGVLRFARFNNYRLYAHLALKSRGAPWRKALFLDLFLNDLHHKLRGRYKPDFTMLFLNAGAHIQHHYMLNSPEIEKQGPCNPDWYINSWDDPLAEMLVVYDRILGDYLLQDDINLIMATGLQQLPYPQTTYYYRLRDHQKFLEIFGISPIAVFPRMTRDFLVEFSNDADAAIAEKILRSLISSSNNMKLFEEIENRGNSLFVTLTYSNEIFDDTEAVGQGKRILLKEETVFVAIKNGMHDSQGYVYLSKNMSRFGPRDGDHVKSLYSTVIDFFGQN